MQATLDSLLGLIGKGRAASEGPSMAAPYSPPPESHPQSSSTSVLCGSEECSVAPNCDDGPPSESESGAAVLAAAGSDTAWLSALDENDHSKSAPVDLRAGFQAPNLSNPSRADESHNEAAGGSHQAIASWDEDEALADFQVSSSDDDGQFAVEVDGHSLASDSSEDSPFDEATDDDGEIFERYHYPNGSVDRETSRPYHQAVVRGWAFARTCTQTGSIKKGEFVFKHRCRGIFKCPREGCQFVSRPPTSHALSGLPLDQLRERGKPTSVPDRKTQCCACYRTHRQVVELIHVECAATIYLFQESQW